ncbi:MAG TPA: peptide ABC transporter substrate-binding protein, partial [Agrobacterium sp.]|nr:peptide ABC transporter substrate-binding protein [Agrobacterium sp.]
MTKIKKGMTATFVALALAGTAFTAAPAFAAGKMTISSPQDPGSWDPIDTFLVQWAAVATNIFDG